MSDKHPNLAAALAAFQAEMPTVAKTKRANVGQYSYTYADLADVTEAGMPALTRHGLAYAGSSRHVEGGRYEVVGILSHESGEQREGALPIHGNNPQQLGSSITYMRRYLFGVMTGIVTDGDDDGALASAQTEQKKQRRRAAAETSHHREGAGGGPPTLGAPMTAKSRGRMFALFGKKGIPEKDDAGKDQLGFINYITGEGYTSRGDLTEAHCQEVITALEERPDAPKDAAS